MQSFPLSNFRTFLWCQQEIPYPLSTHSLFLPSLCHWQPLLYFLSLWICLFWIFHINEIMDYVVFCDWLLSYRIIFSTFIQVVACISISFCGQKCTPLYEYATFCLSVPQWMGILVISVFWVLWAIVLWIFRYTFFFFLKHLFSVFLDEYQEEELVDHMVILCLFWGIIKLLSKVAVPFYVPTSNVWGSHSPHPHKHLLLLSVFFIVVSLVGVAHDFDFHFQWLKLRAFTAEGSSISGSGTKILQTAW